MKPHHIMVHVACKVTIHSETCAELWLCGQNGFSVLHVKCILICIVLCTTIAYSVNVIRSAPPKSAASNTYYLLFQTDVSNYQQHFLLVFVFRLMIRLLLRSQLIYLYVRFVRVNNIHFQFSYDTLLFLVVVIVVVSFQFTMKTK